MLQTVVLGQTQESVDEAPRRSRAVPAGRMH
uniref:Uncharacterized protein n=1 Tax=Arundo donax TaxID=35708 RepID=A0A0A9BAX7_ARUDO